MRLSKQYLSLFSSVIPLNPILQSKSFWDTPNHFQPLNGFYVELKSLKKKNKTEQEQQQQKPNQAKNKRTVGTVLLQRATRLMFTPGPVNV